MQNFAFYNPTRLVFGKDTVEQLTDLIPAKAERILLVYGGGSIKKNGLYDRVIAQIEKRNLVYHELLNEDAETLAVLPSVDGREQLLVGGKDSV